MIKKYIYLKYNYYERIIKGVFYKRKGIFQALTKLLHNMQRYLKQKKEEIHAYINKSIMSKYLTQQQFDNRVDVSSYYESKHNSKDLPSTLS